MFDIYLETNGKDEYIFTCDKMVIERIKTYLREHNIECHYTRRFHKGDWTYVDFGGTNQICKYILSENKLL